MHIWFKFICIFSLVFSVELAADWPHWRGPSRDGVSPETSLPQAWKATCIPPTPPEQPAAAPAPVPSEPARGRGGRGRGGFGQESRPLTPLDCSEIKTENVSWKLPLPAYSGSTPIIWGDLIFLNVATAADRGELELWAVDRTTQTVRWKRPLAGGNLSSASRTCRRRRRSPTAATSGS